MLAYGMLQAIVKTTLYQMVYTQLDVDCHSLSYLQLVQNADEPLSLIPAALSPTEPPPVHSPASPPCQAAQGQVSAVVRAKEHRLHT